MGFRDGAYATVWEINPTSQGCTKVKLSISKKNRETGEYETEFSNWCLFLQTGTAAKAARLKERDRIKLNSVDVSNSYDKEKNRTYYNFKVWNFEMAEEQQTNNADTADPQPTVDEGEPENEQDGLPF